MSRDTNQAAMVILWAFLVLPILEVRANCMFGRRDQEEATPSFDQGLVIDLDQPAACSGVITQWDLCYYRPKPELHGGKVPIELQVWRFDELLTEGTKVFGYEVNVSVPENAPRFQCVSIEVPPDKLLDVTEGDFLGMWIFSSAILPVVKYTIDFRHLLIGEPEAFSSIPSVVEFPVAAEMIYTVEGLALHLSATIKAENATDENENETDENATDENAADENGTDENATVMGSTARDSTPTTVIITVSALAAVELVLLVLVLVLCICRAVRRRVASQGDLNKDSEQSKHPESTENRSNGDSSTHHLRVDPRTSQYYDTIDELYSYHEASPPPPVSTRPVQSLPHPDVIRVKRNTAYNHFGCSQEESPMQPNTAHCGARNMSVSSGNQTGTLRSDQRDSRISYAYPSSLRGVFVHENDDSTYSATTGELI